MKPADFKNTTPKLVLEEYFSGKTKATGLFEDRFGTVRNQFIIDTTGTWDGNMLTLDEHFLYQNGKTEFRHWEIIKTGENTYSGATEQIIGIALGQTSGTSFYWTYNYKLDVGDKIWEVRFDDWMFLHDNGILSNKATVYRWGFKIGTVFLSFQKVPA